MNKYVIMLKVVRLIHNVKKTLRRVVRYQRHPAIKYQMNFTQQYITIREGLVLMAVASFIL